jgi:hypothetical protein
VLADDSSQYRCSKSSRMEPPDDCQRCRRTRLECGNEQCSGRPMSAIASRQWEQRRPGYRVPWQLGSRTTPAAVVRFAAASGTGSSAGSPRVRKPGSTGRKPGEQADDGERGAFLCVTTCSHATSCSGRRPHRTRLVATSGFAGRGWLRGGMNDDAQINPVSGGVLHGEQSERK